MTEPITDDPNEDRPAELIVPEAELVQIPQAMSPAVPRGPAAAVPAVIAELGEEQAKRFATFFTDNIRNRNTREAYYRAARQFFAWCECRELGFAQIESWHVAGYVEELGERLSKPSVKQHLAAIRMLFDWLVVGQVCPTNPAAAVRGPKHSVRKGKTPILSEEDAKQLLESIDASTVIGARDRALIAAMIYTFGRVSAVLGMNGEDDDPNGKRWWLRLHEKNGRDAA